MKASDGSTYILQISALMDRQDLREYIPQISSIATVTIPE